MVAKKVEDRYQTMSEVVADLEQCSAGQPTSVSIQQSVSTNPDADVLTFLKDIPACTSQKPKPKATAKSAKKLAPAKTGKDNRKFILAAVGAGLLGLAILAGIIFRIKTKDGTLVVEVNQPDAVVAGVGCRREGRDQSAERKGHGFNFGRSRQASAEDRKGRFRRLQSKTS